MRACVLWDGVGNLLLMGCPAYSPSHPLPLFHSHHSHHSHYSHHSLSLSPTQVKDLSAGLQDALKASLGVEDELELDNKAEQERLK